MYLNPWDSRPSIVSHQFTSPNLVEVSGFRIPFLSPLLIQIVAPSYYWNFHSISLHLIKRISNRIIKRAITEKISQILSNRGCKETKRLLYTFTQQNEHCDWLILGRVPLIKFKFIPNGIQLRSCCPRAEYNNMFLP